MLRSLFIPLFLLILSACTLSSKHGETPPQVVRFVDFARYAGTWFEISRLPNSFQEGCTHSIAKYALRQDGKLDVENTCRRNNFERGSDTVSGRARVVDPATNARLKVSFFWPFEGDYWILELGADYDYAVVGTPNRKYLWILSRTPQMDPALYRGIMERMRRQGFNTSQLTMTPQRR